MGTGPPYLGEHDHYGAAVVVDASHALFHVVGVSPGSIGSGHAAMVVGRYPKG